jgi:hypothetical protein
MAILYDARGNELLGGGFPDITTGQTFTDGRTISATLSALNAETVMDLMGCATVTFDVRTAAAVLTYLWEGTIDGTNYFALPAFANYQLLAANAIAEQYVTSVTPATTHSGSYTVGVTGLRRLRLRVSAFTSGSITVAARGSKADLLIYGRPLPATLHVTATAAANTAATATLPAAGVGMFHYITSIEITRNATAALAGTATIIHTSTNLPGTPAWSVGNAMAAGGTQRDVEYQPACPLKSLVANTNTTVVAAAGGAAVLGRVNVSYYVGF